MDTGGRKQGDTRRKADASKTEKAGSTRDTEKVGRGLSGVVASLIGDITHDESQRRGPPYMRLEEEVGNQEAEQTQRGHNLQRHTGRV